MARISQEAKSRRSNSEERFQNEKVPDPESKFKSTVKGNLFLVFKDKTTKWVYEYELKKIIIKW